MENNKGIKTPLRRRIKRKVKRVLKSIEDITATKYSEKLGTILKFAVKYSGKKDGLLTEVIDELASYNGVKQALRQLVSSEALCDFISCDIIYQDLVQRR